MPPKRKKDKKRRGDGDGGGGGGGGGGGRGGGGEDVLELRRQVLDAEVQLREELKVVDRLTRENHDKSEQLRELEALLQSEREKHAEEVELVREEAATTSDAAVHEATTLRSKAAQMSLDLEAYSVMERERDQLRERVQELLDQMQSESKEHAEQVHVMKKEMFNLRMQLEQTFRKSLQDLDGLYQKKAFEAMSEQSRNALMTNANLREELQLQSISVENLLRRYKKQEKQLKDLRINKDTLEKTHEMQIKQIAGLKRHQYEYESRLSDMQVALARLSSERDSAQGAAQAADGASSAEVAEMERALGAAEEEASKYRILYEKAQMRAVKWKARAFELGRKQMQQTRVDKVNASLALREAIATDPEHGSPSSVLRSPSSRADSASTTDISFGRTELDSYQDVVHIWKASFPTASHRAATSHDASRGGGGRRGMQPSLSTPGLGSGAGPGSVGRSQTAVPGSRSGRRASGGRRH